MHHRRREAFLAWHARVRGEKVAGRTVIKTLTATEELWTALRFRRAFAVWRVATSRASEEAQREAAAREHDALIQEQREEVRRLRREQRLAEVDAARARRCADAFTGWLAVHRLTKRRFRTLQRVRRWWFGHTSRSAIGFWLAFVARRKKLRAAVTHAVARRKRMQARRALRCWMVASSSAASAAAVEAVVALATGSGPGTPLASPSSSVGRGWAAARSAYTPSAASRASPTASEAPPQLPPGRGWSEARSAYTPSAASRASPTALEASQLPPASPLSIDR
jgi:hypothetical protein